MKTKRTIFMIAAVALLLFAIAVRLTNRPSILVVKKPVAVCGKTNN
jgi:hypothetical protein